MLAVFEIAPHHCATRCGAYCLGCLCYLCHLCCAQGHSSWLGGMKSTSAPGTTSATLIRTSRATLMRWSTVVRSVAQRPLRSPTCPRVPRSGACTALALFRMLCLEVISMHQSPIAIV